MQRTWGRYILVGLVGAAVAPSLWRMGAARWTEYQWRSASERADEISTAGRPADAIIEYQQAFDASLAFGEDDPRRIAAAQRLARAYTDRKQFSDAYSLQLHLLQLTIRKYGANSAEAASQVTQMARLRLQEGNAIEATSLAGQALDTWQRLAQGDHPDMAQALQIMIDGQIALGNKAASAPYFEWLLGIRRRELGSEHPDLAPLEIAYANVLDQVGKGELAARFREHAAAIAGHNAPAAVAPPPTPAAAQAPPAP